MKVYVPYPNIENINSYYYDNCIISAMILTIEANSSSEVTNKGNEE